MRLVAVQRHFGPVSFFIAMLSINLVTILSIDMYAPALPGMQLEFDVSESYLNLTMFAFFLFSAFGVIAAGPLSDRLGRKPLLLVSCILYTASSAVCAVAPGVLTLTAARIGQALAYGAVATLETAIVKDAYDGDSLQLAMTLLQSLIIVGPVFAPFIGTLVLSLASWRCIFWVLAALGVCATVVALLVDETRPAGLAAPEGFGTMFAGMGELLKERRFMSLTLFMSVLAMPYFAWIAVVSYVLLNTFQMSYLGYSAIYACACIVSVVSPYVYMWLSKRASVGAILRLAILAVAVSAVLYFTISPLAPLLFLLAFVPYALFEGIVRPMAFVVLLDRPDHEVASASSFVNFSYCVFTSVGTVLGTLHWHSFIFGLAVILAVCAVVLVGLYAMGESRPSAK